MKQYPKSFVVSPEMDHLKAVPWTDFLGQLIRGVLMMSHMSGYAPFPCPRPCGGWFSGTTQVPPP